MKLQLKAPQRRTLMNMIWKITAVAIGLACFFKVYQESFHLYLTPSEALERHPEHAVRVGGLLLEGSLHQDIHTGATTFHLIDQNDAVLAVHFYGTAPRLLKENQETIVFGAFQGEQFVAQDVLAKHDEYYRPKP